MKAFEVKGCQNYKMALYLTSRKLFFLPQVSSLQDKIQSHNLRPQNLQNKLKVQSHFFKINE